MSGTIAWDSQPMDKWCQRYAQGKFVLLDGKSTHFIEKGEGEPVILIHGFNMDVNTWLLNIDTLAKKYKIYALDLWGFGFSTREPLEVGYELFVQQVHLFMETQGIRKASLVGHSMGGGTAIQYCLLHPEKVNKLVLVDTTGFPNPLPFRAKIFNLPGVGETLLRLKTDRIRRKNLEDLWIHNTEMLTDPLFERFTRFQKIEGTSKVMLAVLRKEFFHTLGSEIQQLGTMNIPTMIVWGRNDKSVPLEIGKTISQILEGSRFQVIDHAGHLPNFECPDQFNDLVAGFL